MNKIKVLRIIARLNIGGPAIHVILLASGLDKEKFESLLVCGNVGKSEGDMFYYAQEKDVVPYFIPELGRELSFFDDFRALIKIFLLISKESPDIIHTHTAKAGALGRLAGIVYNFLHLFGKKPRLVHTFHGHVFNGYFNFFKTKIFILIERFLALFTFKIITVSESVRGELVSLHIANFKKIEVIPLGFDLDKFLNLPIRKQDALSIGIVGRLVPIKNHRLFLDSAAQVIKNNPGLSVRFKIIGDGELRSDLENYAKNVGIAGYVDFLGWVKDLHQVYSGLDIVALTSLNEGTPVSIIEAMASERAVVATQVGGVVDLLGGSVSDNSFANSYNILERGIIVKSADFIGLSKALERLIKDQALRNKLSGAARIYAKNKFHKLRLFKDMENLYLRSLSLRFKM